jgi:hypothetical protein
MLRTIPPRDPHRFRPAGAAPRNVIVLPVLFEGQSRP